MSILSTNHRLISIGESYSAGNGIDITDQVISVTGDATPYSAGENIDIQDHIISGKDWSQDITDASSHAYNETTAWVQENYANSADMTYISAVVDTKLDASAWSTVSADYATESYVIMADNITYDRAKGYVDSQQFAKESACQSAFDYLNTNKLDVSAFDLPNSAHWNEATNVVEGNSAAWFDNVGDVEVNNWVYNNSASTEDTTNVVETNSASWSNGGGIYDVVTANSASWNEVSSKVDTNEFTTISSMFSGAIDYVSANADDPEVTNLVQTNSGVWNEVTNKLDTTSFSEVSGSFYTNDNPSGFITGVDLSNYYTKNETSGADEIAQAIADIPVGDPEVNAYVTNNSASINGTTDLVQNSSGLWNDVAVYQSNSANYLTAHQDISYKLDESAFADVSGTFLTAINIPESASWEDATQAYQNNSATYLTSHQDISYKLDTSSFTAWSAAQAENDYQLSAGTGIDLVDDDINKITRIDVTGDFGNPEVEAYVQNTSSTIDEVNTSYQTNSGTFLTAHQAISADEWNDCYDNVNTNSGAWGGTPLPLSSRDGIDLEIDNGTLYIGASALTGAVNTYEQNSASYVVENNFEYDGNDLITAYNGSAFAGQGGGGDVPTGTMNVSGLEYNAVNEISGYNGSAIAQYGAEKQWLVHDDTLVHASNSAQYALGVNLSAVAQLLGIDETVLFSGSTQSPSLTDSIWNYKKVLLLIGDDTNDTKVSNSQMYYTDDIAAIGSGFSIFQTCKRKAGGYVSMGAYINVNNGGSGFTVASVGGWASWDNSTCQYNGAGTWAPRFYKVIGIGRKQ